MKEKYIFIVLSVVVSLGACLDRQPSHYPTNDSLTPTHSNNSLLNVFDSVVHQYIDDEKCISFNLSLAEPLMSDSGKSRVYYLTITDSIFENLAQNETYNIPDYELLFNKYWYSKYDWLVNLLLYSKTGENAFILGQYESCKISEWRLERKKADFEKWKSILEKR